MMIWQVLVFKTPEVLQVSSVVSDDTVRNVEPVDDVEEEFDRFFRADVGDGLGFYPLGKLVDCYKLVSEAARALLEGPTMSRP